MATNGLDKISQQPQETKPVLANAHAHGAQSPTRRRLISGAAGGGAVLLALHARTVLGQTACASPSGTWSGNQSPRPGGPPPCVLGRSPGFWKQPQWFQGAWSMAGVAPPSFRNVDPATCPTGLGELGPPDILTPGTLFGAIFSPDVARTSMAPGMDPMLGVGLWEILAFPASFGAYGQLARHCIAALLNARSIPDYPITEAQAKAMWSQGVGAGYCPMPTDCGSAIWSAEQIIAYITGTFGDGFEFPVCKKPKGP